MQFNLVDKVIGNFDANGVIGLAPTGDSKSYIDGLFGQGVITDLKVGLNFENPSDRDQLSTITFGSWDFDQVDGG